MDEDVKMKAAIAGVVEYIKVEEDGALRSGQRNQKAPSPWALNGRQTIMQMRALLQRRVLRRR